MFDSSFKLRLLSMIISWKASFLLTFSNRMFDNSFKLRLLSMIFISWRGFFFANLFVSLGFGLGYDVEGKMFFNFILSSDLDVIISQDGVFQTLGYEFPLTETRSHYYVCKICRECFSRKNAMSFTRPSTFYPRPSTFYPGPSIFHPIPSTKTHTPFSSTDFLHSSQKEHSSLVFTRVSSYHHVFHRLGGG